MRRILLHYGLISKRFFKKYSFLLILCAIPLLTLGLKAVSTQDSGMLKIVICMESEEEIARKLTDEMLHGKSVIQFTFAESREEAREAVIGGQADAAWIFPQDFSERVEAAARAGEMKAAVLIWEREDNVALQLSRMKLFGLIYPHASYSMYEQFIRGELYGETATSEELRLDYEDSRMEGDLFRLAYLDGGEKEGEKNYLTAPLRGMLALLILLCGLAADMYLMQDEEKGVYDRTPGKARRKYVLIYQCAAMIPAAAAVLSALYLTGNFMGWGREIFFMVCYLLDCNVFCSILHKLLGNSQKMGVFIPVLMLGMFAVCPVFFNLKRFRMIQYVLPPSYYLQAAYSAKYLIGMLVYVVVGCALDFLLCRLYDR